jgi:hypothetical protein
LWSASFSDDYHNPPVPQEKKPNPPPQKPLEDTAWPVNLDEYQVVEIIETDPFQDSSPPPFLEEKNRAEHMNRNKKML